MAEAGRRGQYRSTMDGRRPPGDGASAGARIPDESGRQSRRTRVRWRIVGCRAGPGVRHDGGSGAAEGRGAAGRIRQGPPPPTTRSPTTRSSD